MQRYDFAFPSADGMTRIHAVEWVPEGAPQAVLVVSHGVSEYILRYEGLARFLTERGFVVAGHDHLGHGTSVAEGHPRLYFGKKGSWDWVVADLYQRRQLAGQRFPGVPVFLMGHSMGSFLARTYLIRYPGTVQAAVIMGTGQQSAAMTAGGRLVAARETRRLGGDDKVSKLAEGLAFGSYNKLFAPNRTSCDWLSADTDNVDAYMADPLCGADATVGLFRQMLLGIRFNQRLSNLRRMDAQTPVLFIAGDKDPVGANGAGVRRTYQEFLRAGMQDCTLKLYPGLRHEILNEKGWQREIFRDIGLWLTAKL